VNQLPVRIRRATELDGEGIGETHAASWEAAYRGIFDPAFLARAAAGRRQGWPAALLRLLDGPGFVLVAERDSRIVGFAHAGPDSQDRPHAEIYGFYTHPNTWSTGAAMALMTEACSVLVAEFADVVLWTLRDAPRARRFYEKAGFAPSGAERAEPLSDWTTPDMVECITVEYHKVLAQPRV
jgi:GNAT superfamily N-acetyltransferase